MQLSKKLEDLILLDGIIIPKFNKIIFPKIMKKLKDVQSFVMKKFESESLSWLIKKNIIPKCFLFFQQETNSILQIMIFFDLSNY